MHINTEHTGPSGDDAGDVHTPNLPREEFTSYARAELGEALTEALLALYKGGPTKPSEALTYVCAHPQSPRRAAPRAAVARSARV